MAPIQRQRRRGPPFRRSARVNPNPNLTITLTPGMVDLRNGGPRNGGAGTCKTLNGAQRTDVHRNLSKNYLKLGNNSAVPFRSGNYHILVKSGTQFRSVPEIIRFAVPFRSVDYHILVKSGTRVPPFRSVPKIIIFL